MPDMTQQRIFFNSSFPRSGSTLLQNILAQNPRFHPTATSGLLDLLLASRISLSSSPQFKGLDPEMTRPAFLGYCAGAMAGYYQKVTDKPVVVDKNRAWFHYYDWVKMFHPDPRFLICIRDLRGVVSSMEKLFRKNRYRQDPTDMPDTMGMITIHNRITHWLNGVPVGLAAYRLIEALQTGTIKHFHVIRFEDLTSNPAVTMRKVYAYLGEPEFEHDFDSVQQITVEDDSQHLFYADHTIRRKVEPVRPDWNEVLGRELGDAIRTNNAAFYRTFYPDAH
jgi:sulfotransferase